MTSHVTFSVDISSGLLWEITVCNGWLLLRVVFNDLAHVAISQPFSSACDWIRSIVHLAQRTGTDHMYMDTQYGNILIDGRCYKYTYRESRGFFYE